MFFFCANSERKPFLWLQFWLHVSVTSPASHHFSRLTTTTLWPSDSYFTCGAFLERTTRTTGKENKNTKASPSCFLLSYALRGRGRWKPFFFFLCVCYLYAGVTSTVFLVVSSLTWDTIEIYLNKTASLYYFVYVLTLNICWTYKRTSSNIDWHRKAAKSMNLILHTRILWDNERGIIPGMLNYISARVLRAKDVPFACETSFFFGTGQRITKSFHSHFGEAFTPRITLAFFANLCVTLEVKRIISCINLRKLNENLNE